MAFCGIFFSSAISFWQWFNYLTEIFSWTIEEEKKWHSHSIFNFKANIKFF